MGKELIRNGGFELGNINFWEEILDFTIEIEAAIIKYGANAGKLTLDGNTGSFRYKDFIEVSGGEIYQFGLWMKNVEDVLIYEVQCYFYDSDLSEITYIVLNTGSGVFDWTQIQDFFIIPHYVSYIRIAFVYSFIGGGFIGYIDSLSVKRIDVEKLAVKHEELIAVENETTKHTVNGEEFFTGIWKHAEYFLDVTSFTETGAASPVTLDVKIETYDPSIEKWRDAMVFQQLSCAASGSETTQEYKSLSSNLGWKQRVTYTTAGAGTIGDCDFKVGVVYKR